ncbi:hypothetical protein Pst134EA_028123 [Puccinia striiformis f. sp. tritici]|uniref:Protein YAE1 n=1 Tax=Puccinia striiformis TaxID=27350 RepID=A0A2S4VQ15_9BASI|nr:hypothetical protein Pst134EA_028123 [Puccinia striiformis f. sp. tritici]KAH9448828.1 hypothetical protein Pst134EA_028123 [Puccinia striiformis f. sp. tritici]KAI9607745.1 hypothetical protein H4Q26_005190 [Puccinia striiformis f. sp. tritici PST-130]POW11569.1 hypothetical protein PSHT_08451 [Puccinia striiformis]
MNTYSLEDWLDESLQIPPEQGHLQISEVEYTRLAEQFHTTGYREGIHKGKEITTQEGFDNGFAAGAQRGKRLGRLRGQASGLLNILLKRMEEGDARVDRVRRLIRDLNQYGIQRPSNSDSQPANNLEGLSNQMEALMADPVHQNHSLSIQYQHLLDNQLLDRCQFELNAILASMDIWLPGL